MWGKINYNLSRKTIIGKKLTNNEKDISHMIQEFESIEKMMSVIYSEKNEGSDILHSSSFDRKIRFRIC